MIPEITAAQFMPTPNNSSVAVACGVWLVSGAFGRPVLRIEGVELAVIRGVHVYHPDWGSWYGFSQHWMDHRAPPVSRAPDVILGSPGVCFSPKAGSQESQGCGKQIPQPRSRWLGLDFWGRLHTTWKPMKTGNRWK